ncbi:glutathione S-transferase [Monoraphidium neglectum]|uniref:Glutathione S-transferase n=1 Tax=Monoraphidium neglectum TaxID=145388 RepID=A0A0D2MF71_9CHLO|nr:glutathione S-transferase [Monoraphidium neglectum]KIY99386.1 glutathione S-transferase [Monoraphidium neglectum]|eukprot:XP_013898406.1 glutathione S-transferase [Monoraphidium neglectum]
MAKAIQLYSLATPNGQKVSVALEELGLAYEAHTIDIRKGDQFSDEFKKINPNSKIPAIVDPDGPGGKPLAVFESGAILLYLSEKAGGKLLPSDPTQKWEALSWLFWQIGGVGPMFGQFGHFHKYAPEKIEYGINRYKTEVKRLLAVLEKQLEGRDYIIGSEYTLADVATFPWVRCLDTGYNAADVVELDSFKNVKDWVARCEARPASKAGLNVTPFPK